MTICLLLLPGDGIGPEIAAATRRVLEAADRRFGLDLVFEEGAIGFGSLAVEATTMPQAVLEHAREVDGVVPGLDRRLSTEGAGRDQPVGRAADRP